MSNKMEVDEKDAPEQKSQMSRFVDWKDFDVDGYASRYTGKIKVTYISFLQSHNAYHKNLL